MLTDPGVGDYVSINVPAEPAPTLPSQIRFGFANAASRIRGRVAVDDNLNGQVDPTDPALGAGNFFVTADLNDDGINAGNEPTAQVNPDGTYQLLVPATTSPVRVRFNTSSLLPGLILAAPSNGYFFSGGLPTPQIAANQDFALAAIAPLFVAPSGATATIHAYGSSVDDTLLVRPEAGNLCRITLGSSSITWPVSELSSIRWYSGGGLDTLLLSGIAVPVTVTDQGPAGRIFVEGTAGNDIMTFVASGAPSGVGSSWFNFASRAVTWNAPFDAPPSLSITTLGGNDSVSIARNNQVTPVGSVDVDAGPGDDAIRSDLPGTIIAGDGDDRIYARNDIAQIIDGGIGVDSALTSALDTVTNVVLDSTEMVDQANNQLARFTLSRLNSLPADNAGSFLQQVGAFDFTGLMRGSYRVDYAQNVTGDFVLTTPSRPNPFTVTVDTAQQSADNHVGYAPPVYITLTSFADLDNDGVNNPNSGFLGGDFAISVTGYIDYNNNGINDPADPDLSSLSPTRVMPRSGIIRFTPVNPEWRIGQSSAAGVAYSFVPGQFQVTLNVPQTPVALNRIVDGTLYVMPFSDGNPPPVGLYAGLIPSQGDRVWLDWNSNFRIDPGEPLTTTDADGRYSFTGLAPRPRFDIRVVDASVTDLTAGFITSSDLVFNGIDSFTSPSMSRDIDGLSSQAVSRVYSGRVGQFDSNGTFMPGVDPRWSTRVFVDGAVTGSPNGLLDAGEPFSIIKADASFLIAPINRPASGAVLAVTSPDAPSNITFSHRVDFRTTNFVYAPSSSRYFTGQVRLNLRGSDLLQPARGALTYVDLNNNNVADDNEPRAVGESFLFTDLPAGTYTLRALPPAGEARFSPASVVFNYQGFSGERAPTLRLPRFSTTELPSVFGKLTLNFTESRLTRRGLTWNKPITLYRDNNLNGQPDADEPRALVDQATGLYEFRDLSLTTGPVRFMPSSTPPGFPQPTGTQSVSGSTDSLERLTSSLSIIEPQVTAVVTNLDGPLPTIALTYDTDLSAGLHTGMVSLTRADGVIAIAQSVQWDTGTRTATFTFDSIPQGRNLCWIGANFQPGYNAPPLLTAPILLSNTPGERRPRRVLRPVDPGAQLRAIRQDVQPG
jgi:hypothetical protein